MCRVRERPCLLKVGSNSDDENAFATLRDAVIRRVKQSKCNFVVEVGFRSFGVKPFEAAKVREPILAVPHPSIGKRQLQNDVIKIFRERLPNQTFDVLEHESFRADFTDRSDGFGEKVSAVGGPAVLSPD